VRKHPANTSAHLSRRDRLAVRIADLSATVGFLLANGLLWGGWFVTAGLGSDPYPYQFLTLFLSLEAIVLTTFVLVQTRLSGARDAVARDHDYETNTTTLELTRAVHALTVEVRQLVSEGKTEAV